ncbi:MAG: Ldh family oxidoreductase, partial [Aliihoeflea sp.]
ALVRYAQMADQIAGSDGARVPGHRRIALRKKLTAEGISFDEALIDEIGAIGAA